MLSEEDMYLFFEKAIRGGYSNCHKKYSRANNKYVKGYDLESDDIFLMYWDINSLYPTVMVENLLVKTLDGEQNGS